jgi:hypothetical protein
MAGKPRREKVSEYRSDYPNEPIGGDNPYYCCSYCKVSDPAINGRLDGHGDWCEWRIREEAKDEADNSGG